MAFRNQLKPIALTFCALSLAAGFLNCSKSGSTGATSSPSKSNSGSGVSSPLGGGGALQGGDGYSGKPTYNLKTAQACSDGQPDSTIIKDTTTNQFQLTRSACANLTTPQTLQSSTVGLDSQGYFIAYQNHIFLNSALPADNTRQGYAILCTASDVLTSSGQTIVRITIVNVVKYLTPNGYRLSGIGDAQYVATLTGAITDTSTIVDALSESKSGGTSIAGGVNTATTGGLMISSSSANALTPITYGRVPYVLEIDQGSALTYSNGAFGGNIQFTSGPISLTCDQFQL